jgi:hypothetical protein
MLLGAFSEETYQVSFNDYFPILRTDEPCFAYNTYSGLLKAAEVSMIGLLLYDTVNQ